MKKHFGAILLAFFAAVLGVAVASATGDGDESADDTADNVFLGEQDLAERMEIWRNQFRRMTPGDMPLVQDVGTWPAAWEEFSHAWGVAPAERDLATWLVPVTAARSGALTVLRDANGTVLWSGATDFAKDESASVTLTGSFVDEEEWPLYEAAREEVERRYAEAFSPVYPGGMRGTNGPYTNGLRFTGISVDTNGDYRLDFAWETNGDVQVFCRAMHYECWTNFGVVSTNDENQVVTNDVVNWRQVPGEKFMGIPDYWESLGVTTVTNGEGSFTDTNHANPLFDRVRFYAAAQYADSDNDGIMDGEEWLWGITSTTDDSDGDGLSDFLERTVYHTDPYNPDTDGDGWTDGEEVNDEQTDPLDRLSATRLARGVLVHGVKYSGDETNQWVQLHCSGPRRVDVSGFRVQAAGTSWETVATLPDGTWMTPGHFLLIGDEGVTNSDLTAQLELATAYTNQPTAGVRLMAPESSTNAPVDVMFYGRSSFNAQGLDTSGWLSNTTSLWASATRHLERWQLGLDRDIENDWRHIEDGYVYNAEDILDSDGDYLTDEEEYTSGYNPLNHDMDADGLVDGFETSHALNPTAADSDGDGTLDGDETDPETQQPYSEKQQADGLTLTTVGPTDWEPGGDLGLGGSVTYTITDLDGFAVWGRIWEGGATNEAYNVSVSGSANSWQWTLTSYYGHTFTLLLAIPNGTNAIQIVVTDNSTGSGVITPEEQGADITAAFSAMRLDLEIGDIGEEDEEQPGAFLPNRLVHTNATRTACGLAVTQLPITTTPLLPGTLHLEWDSSVVRVYPEDCPEDGTPIPAFSAPLQGFKGTNVWLEGVSTTNIFMDWKWEDREYGMDHVKTTVYEVRFQTYSNSVPGPDKPHEKNIETRQNESVHYGDFQKCVSHVWTQNPCDLTQYLEGHENADLRNHFREVLKWKIGSSKNNGEWQLSSHVQHGDAPAVNNRTPLYITTAFLLDDIPLDRLVITVVPPATLANYETWYAAESIDTNWWNDLPAFYHSLNIVNAVASHPEGPDCSLWNPPQPKNTFYHPDGCYEMRSKLVGGAHGHQVLYDESGDAILVPPSAGTADRQAAFPIQLNWNLHVNADVIPFVQAAQLDGNPVAQDGTTMTDPMMYWGRNLDRYLECRPIVPNNKPQLDPGDCP